MSPLHHADLNNDRINSTVRARPVFNISKMSLTEMTSCGARLRQLGKGAGSMEEVARRITRFLFEELQDDYGNPAPVLVRLYKTHRLGALPADLQRLALEMLDGSADPKSVQCLTLLATAGVEEAWNSRHRSVNHRVIPLPSEKAVEQFPMVAQLVRQLGLEVSSVVEPNPEVIVDLMQKTFNIFYVSEAPDSPYIPAQGDFVLPYEVKSALGFGGLIPSGDLFAVIFFSRVPISPETADLFKPLALSAKLALIQAANVSIFDAAPA